MVRRTVHIRLDAGVERPEERTDFHHPDLLVWVRSNRTLLVSACVSIVQAWIDTGMPTGQGTLGRFERWVEVMGGTLEVAGMKGFLTNREAFYSVADAETQEWIALCGFWWGQYMDQPITAKDLLEVCKNNNLLLSVLSGRSSLSAQQRIGHALGARRDRVFGIYRILKAGNDGRTNSNANLLESRGGSKTPETTQTMPKQGGEPVGVLKQKPLKPPWPMGKTPQTFQIRRREIPWFPGFYPAPTQMKRRGSNGCG